MYTRFVIWTDFIKYSNHLKSRHALIIKTSFCTFYQHLGAAHKKCWLKYAFSTFFMKKAEKARKLAQNLAK